MTDPLPFRAELLGGPLDGQMITAGQGQRRLELPLPPGRPQIADLDRDPLTPSYTTAVYELAEWEYIEPKDPFLPKRVLVGGRYRYAG